MTYIIDTSEVLELLSKIEKGEMPNYALLSGFEVKFEHTETEMGMLSKAYIVPNKI